MFSINFFHHVNAFFTNCQYPFSGSIHCPLRKLTTANIISNTLVSLYAKLSPSVELLGETMIMKKDTTARKASSTGTKRMDARSDKVMLDILKCV